MKETGRRTAFLLSMLWLASVLPMSAAATEVGEAAYAGHTGNLEWIALLFSSIWALILHFFRISK